MTKTKLYVGISIVGIIAATAAGAAYKEIQRDQACKYKDYYSEHQAKCDEGHVFLSPFSGNKRDRAIRVAHAEDDGFSSYGRRQVVSIVPDFQGTNESNNNNTLYMYTQTTANVANSGGAQPSYGWATPRAADAGIRYMNAPVYAYAPRYVHRHVTVTTRRYVNDDVAR